MRGENWEVLLAQVGFVIVREVEREREREREEGGKHMHLLLDVLASLIS